MIHSHYYGCGCGFSGAVGTAPWSPRTPPLWRGAGGGGGVGVTDGSNASPGRIGEYRQADGVNYVTSAPTVNYQQLVTLMLAAGDWDVFANVTVSDLGVVNGGGLWVWLGPSSFPSDSTLTDNSGPGDNVSWFGTYTAVPAWVAGSLGPIRLSSNAIAGAQLRAWSYAESGVMEVFYDVRARRMR